MVYIHEIGVSNKIKGETNAWLKQGNTLVKQGDTQGVGSRLQFSSFLILFKAMNLTYLS